MLLATKAEILTKQGSKPKIKVSWGGSYNHENVSAVKAVPGAVFVPAQKADDGIPYWTVPLKLEVARELRDQFGEQLTIGAKLRSWGKGQVRTEGRLRSIQQAANAELPRLKVEYRHLYEALHVGPKGKHMSDAEFREALKGPASYQTADVRFMADCANPANFNHPGCLAADTIVEYNRAGWSRKCTIERLHQRFNRLDASLPGTHWSGDHLTKMRAMHDDGSIGLVPLAAALDSGVKLTYEVQSVGGRAIRATADHPFLTPEGWKKLRELKPGMPVYVDGGQTTGAGKRVRKSELGNSVPRHPYARDRHCGTRVVARHRLVVEADLNGMKFEDYVALFGRRSTADLGSIKYLRPEQVVHHLDYDPHNNSIENLEILESQAEHAKRHGIAKHGNRWVTIDRVKSVREYGYEQTYDLTLAEDPHNFIANGFIVHNTGKTIETLAAICEKDDPVAVLVIAPMSSTVWEDEIRHWLPDHNCYAARGTASERHAVVQKALRSINDGYCTWLVVNVEMLRGRGKYKENDWGRKELIDVQRSFPALFDVQWDAVVLDELHKAGLNNPGTLASKALAELNTAKRIALSGTPMGGKELKLFGVLHWLEPAEFSSKWAFVNSWLETRAGYQDHKIIEGLRQDKADAFYEMLQRYAVRRTKDETAPWLPPKNEIDVWVELEGEQEAQYRKFAEDAEIKIEEEQLTAVGILAEYTRLKQFATATQTVRTAVDREGNLKLQLSPRMPSNKIMAMLEILEELGVPESNEQVIVFSQFKEMVELVCEILHKNKIDAGMVHGGVKVDDRHAAVQRFRDGKDQVIVMNTYAGGVSINLEEANTVIFLDETWNPDDQEQASDRAHRTTKSATVTVYYIRSRATIEEYIQSVTADKFARNWDVLDARRKGLRAIKTGAA